MDNRLSGADQRKTLFIRLLLAVFLATIAAHFVVVGATLHLNISEIERNLQSRTQDILAITEQVVSGAQVGARSHFDEQTTAALQRLVGVDELSITAIDGSISYHSEAHQTTRSAPAWFSRWLSIEANEVNRVITMPNGVTANIYFRLGVNPYYDMLWLALVRQVTLLSLGAVLVFWLAYAAIRATLRPLQRLISATETVAEGDLSVRLPVHKSNRDLGPTFVAFNNMAQEIEHLVNKLDERQSTLTTLFNAAPVGIVQMSTDDDMVYVNPAMQRFAGVDGEWVSTQVLLENFHPEDRVKVPSYWRDYLNEQQFIHFVHRQLDCEGTYRWVKTSVVKIENSSQTGGKFVAFLTDVSKEVALKQNSERSSQLYQTLSEINSAIINSSSREELFSVVSQIFVQTGGFCIASFSVPDQQPEYYCSNILFASSDDGVTTQEIHTRYHKTQHSAGSLSAEALATGLPQVRNEFSVEFVEPIDAKEKAILSKIKSAVVVPVKCQGVVVAALSVASSSRHFFSLDVQEYVEKIAANISHALDNFARQNDLQTTLTLAEQSERQLATTVRSIGDAVLVTDAKGLITMMNPAAETLCGWQEKRALGRAAGDVLRWVTADDQLVVKPVVEAVIEQRHAVSNHEQEYLLDGQGIKRPIAQTGAPIRNNSCDTVDGVVLVIRDQSEDFRVQDALRKGENRYATLIETLPIGVFVFEAETKQFFINSELRRILKLWKRQVTIHDVENLVHLDDVHALRQYFSMAKERGETVITDYYRYRCDDDTIIWAKMRLTPTLDDAGNIVSMVGGVLDVTAERDHLNKIETLSTMYATLSRINYLVVTAQAESALLKDVAQTIAQVPGFDQVSVYQFDQPGHGGRLSFGSLGLSAEEGATLDEDNELINHVESKLRHLAGHSREKCFVINDCLSDPNLDEVIKDFCLGQDINAALALPVTKSNKAYGSILILSKQPDIFTQQVQELVAEVSEVVSFALTQLHNEEQKRIAELELSRNEERLRLGLSVTHTGMFEINFLTGKVILDEVSRGLSGIAQSITECSINTFYRALPLALKEGIESAAAQPCSSATAQDTFSLQAPIQQSDKTALWLRMYGAITAERTAAGEPVRLLGFISDITHLKEQEDREYLAATVFDKSSESILILGENRKVIMANQAFCDTYGYDVDEVLDQSSNMFRSQQHDDSFYDSIQLSIKQTGSWHGEWWRKRKDGQEYPALAVISAVSDSSGAITHQVIQEMDISDQKEAEQRISNLAYHDALTNLPNRSLLRDRVEQAIAVAEREEETMALLFLDLDHFKNINDSLGHAVGDLLLQEVANRLQRSIRKSDTVGRLGGDEFMMLLPDADADDAAHVAQKVLEECIKPYELDSHNLAVTPSIGIAMFPRDGSDHNELLKKADTAMYRAKDEGRNGYRFFTPEMNQAVFQRMVLESSLRKAVEKQEFELHYQPKYSIDAEHLVGVEALIRWHQPEMGMVSPAQFIPVAEDSGLIVDIGQWVLYEACRQISEWRNQGLPDIKVSINFSTRQFKSRGVEQSVFDALEQRNLPGDCLEIEITESLLAQDMDDTLKSLNMLKQCGIDISVDDFGTGYSSLSYLKRFPIDRLKIDQSFVRDLERESDDRAIASAVITMGHSLGIKVIAEGVETKEQLGILQSMGCDEVQGYYLGRPMNAGAMTRVMQHYQAALNSRCVALK